MSNVAEKHILVAPNSEAVLNALPNPGLIQVRLTHLVRDKTEDFAFLLKSDFVPEGAILWAGLKSELVVF